LFQNETFFRNRCVSATILVRSRQKSSKVVKKSRQKSSFCPKPTLYRIQIRHFVALPARSPVETHLFRRPEGIKKEYIPLMSDRQGRFPCHGRLPAFVPVDRSGERQPQVPGHRPEIAIGMLARACPERREESQAD
jgi:hypothetical protein